ncbi:DNA polymerase III subunit [Terriglobus aquaticus]|uniref:DNA polymerase III subunit delta' n=1 Tax=Terriglobus aquaticus TaxID=940139 RepID=A0ABW9KJ92_9BACT|nr:DNA polymerase III subunit delta' C-terminal domain-containing protein [Terriglobus aquaticus]
MIVGFDRFLGNAVQVEGLRRAIAAGRLPHSLILAGPRGSGKYTLALMVTMALLCERQPRVGSSGGDLADFCGVCRNCTRIAESADLKTRVADALAAREEMRDADKKDTRILVQTHPSVLVIPPDPPQLLIKLGQVRTLIGSIYRAPVEAPRSVAIFTAATFMKEAANSLLKVLEEPPAHAHIVLLAEHVGELLPTIRSRCAVTRLGALPAEELEHLLAERRPEWKPQQRALVARLAQGAAGRALGFDVEAYMAARADAMVLLRSATDAGDHTALFKMTETYRAGAEGQAKTTAMLQALAGLLEDILLLQSGVGERVQNVDLIRELERLAQAVDFRWIENAVRGLDGVYTGMRRNLLRSLALDSFAESLAGSR